MPETQQCPYCAEVIHRAAVRCRYCRSRLTSFDIDHWHRSHPEARWTGVCAAIAHVGTVPVAGVRLAFILFTLFVHVAPLVYAALWLIIPKTPGGISHLETTLEWALHFARSLSGRPTTPPCPRDATPTPHEHHAPPQ